MTTDLLTEVLCGRRQTTGLPPADWEKLLGQARSSRLIGRLALQLRDSGSISAVPEAPRRHLEAALRLADRQQHVVRWEVDRIRSALSLVDTPIVLLKGAAYAMAGLPPSAGRLFSDVDILVERSQLDRTEGALMACGWIAQERDPYNDRYYRQWMHELPPLSHIVRGTTIDVHHTITPPTSAFNVDGSRLLRDTRALGADARLRILQPIDMVLHSAVHLFQEGEFHQGLRDLLDMNDLLRHFVQTEPGFPANLIARAHELALQVPLHHALHHLHRLFGTQLPPDTRDSVRQLRPAWPQRMLMGGLLAVALRPEHPSCHRRGAALVRWLLYVRSHWLRMPLYLLAPHLVRKAWMRRFPDQPIEQRAADEPA